MNKTSNKSNWFFAAIPLVSAALVTGPVLAQESRQEQRQESEATKQPKPHILEQSKLIGAAVTNGEKAEKLVKLGSISDLVIDGRSGEVRHAILSSGGTLGIGKKQTAISWDTLTWDAENSQFTFAMTAKELEKLPAFDAKKIHMLNKSTIEAGSEKSGGTARSADLKRGKLATNGDHDAVPAKTLILASKVGDCTVMARKDKLGTGATVFIEPKSGAVAFVGMSVGGVIGIGDSNYIIPWKALKLVQPVGKDEVQMQLDKSKKELNPAPKLEDKGADVNKAAFREKVYGFYGVEPPAFEPEKEARKTRNSQK